MDRITSTLTPLLGRLSELWAAQSKTNRIIGVSALAAILLAIVGFGALYGLKKPEYGVLFSNLSAEDASAVTIKLKEAKVPYQLGDGGKTVSVPVANLYEERIALAGSGVIKGAGTGYELFDKMNLGMTDSQEKTQRIRAIEGELQRTISGLSEVDAARVHIAMPDASLYSSSQAPTTASIAIHTKPGMTLGPQEVRGITMLASGAVDGLKPDHVTIVNQDGSVLVPTAQAGGPGEAQADALKLTQDQLVAKQRYESTVQESIQGMLDGVIGAKRSAVRVATDMSFDANTTDTKSYAPQGTVRSQQTERESYQGTGGRNGPSGVPSTTSNVLPTYQGQQNGGNGRYNKSKNTVNYDISESHTKHIDAPGKVLRTSVAVLVNVPPQSVAAPGVPSATTPAAYRLSAADVTKIRNVVAAAAGIDTTRGDQLSVEAIPFAPGPAELAAAQTPATILGMPVIALATIGAIALLGAAGFGFAAYRRRSFRPSEGLAELPSFDSSLTEELPSFEEHPMLEGSVGLAAPIRSAADLTREQMIEYVTTVATENPDNIAKLVKLWLAE